MMKNRVLFLITVVTVISLVVGLFVFRVSGSNSSVSVEGCDPYNVKIERGEEEKSVLISWKSKAACSAYIIYGGEMKDLHLIGIDLENEIKDREHKVVLNSLISSKVYFFSIVSDGTTYGKDGLPISFSISSL